MKKFRQFIKSFHKNVIKQKKYKAFLHLIFDKEYRNSIERLYHLTKSCTRSEVKKIHLDKIEKGHKVIYKNYTASLIGKVTPPIKVVYDNLSDKYIIVDGNHRFLSKVLATSDGLIECEVML